MGMQTMDNALAELFMSGQISRQDALMHCSDPETFERLVTGFTL